MPSLPAPEDPIVLGLRAMSAHARPGKCYSAAEIARELHVDESTIRYTERSALAKVAQRLRSGNKELFDELLAGWSLEEFRPAKVSRAMSASERKAEERRRRAEDPEQREAYLTKRRAAYAAHRHALALAS